MGGIEAHGAGEFARTVGQGDGMLLYASPLAHEVDAMNGLDCAHEDGVGASFGGDDDVEGPVHSVQKKHVGVSGWTEHGLGASCPSATDAVCREIFRPAVGFALDDPSGRRSFGRTMHEDRANELGRDVEDFAIVERTRQGEPGKRRTCGWE